MSAQNHLEKTAEGQSESIKPSETLKKEIERLRKLREDVLLLRFYLGRRTDVIDLIDDRDRLISETALKSSLEILEWHDKGARPVIGKEEDKKSPYTDYVVSAASALMYSVDILVKAARMAAERDATDELPLPITPESLRASLPREDIAHALGENSKDIRKRMVDKTAKDYIRSKTYWTVIFFVLASGVHLLLTIPFSYNIPKGTIPSTLVDLMLPYAGVILSAFLWAATGCYVWILIRFRRFGATFAFDPAQASIFEARIYSGSVTTTVLIFLIFGLDIGKSNTSEFSLPLWAFVLGYAGKLQVELLRVLVERVEDGIRTVFPRRQEKKETPSPEKRGGTPPARPRPDGSGLPSLGKLKKPEDGGS